jgi:hypothetical protein
MMATGNQTADPDLPHPVTGYHHFFLFYIIVVVITNALKLV